MTPQQISDVEALIAANDLDAAIATLDAATAARSSEPPQDDGSAVDADAEYLRGRIAWRRGDKAAAISAYEKAAAADPEGPAPIALDQARQIMNFYHRDLYNP